jgi:hypothetical protein
MRRRAPPAKTRAPRLGHQDSRTTDATPRVNSLAGCVLRTAGLEDGSTWASGSSLSRSWRMWI